MSKISPNIDNSENSLNNDNFQEVDYNEWKSEIHVEKRGEKGAYKTIQEAIDAATPKTKIVIHPGIYKEHLLIEKKSDIEIRSYDPEMPAILMASNSPCILVKNMLPGQTVKLGYLRLVHRGMREEEEENILDDTNEIKEQLDKLNANIYDHLQGKNWIYNNVCQLENFDTNYSLDLSAIEGIMTDNRGVVTAISIFNSTVMLINTQITLGFLTTETTKTIPGIYCERAVLFMESVMVRGNPEFLTCGILAYDTSIKITNSRMVKHKSGGLLASINPSNQIVATKCQFLENTGCGLLIVNKQRTEEYHEFFQDPNIPIKDLVAKPASISALTSSVYLNGEPKKALQSHHGQVSLEGILCDSNVGAGIRIENCCNLSMIKNRFYENVYNGGEIVDCEGLVMLNEFVKNGENGLLVNAFIRKTEVKVSKNTFCENEYNGVLINGRFNNCIVQGNENITGNMKSGICVNGLAFPIIKQNQIYYNLHQGVLVCDDASASIEENKIYSNLKANVAFGGETGFMTRIINNDIYRSRSEGVFCIDCTGGIIARNRIFENNDGIVLFTAKNIEIAENDILRNVRSGCLIGAESEPRMYRNQIKENKFIGIMFRDGSKGEYLNNIIENNPTQCYYTNSCKGLIDIQQEKNKIIGRIDTETRCTIF